MDTLSYADYLNQGLDALFRPVSENGFWNSSENRIIRALNCKLLEDDSFFWYEDAFILHRYPPFALMGAVEWRVSKLADSRFDEKLKANLSWYRPLILDSNKLRFFPSYGIGPLLYAYIKLLDLWPDEEVIDTLATEAIGRFHFSSSEDALLLMGLAANWNRLPSAQREWIRQGATKYCSWQRENGLILVPTHRASCVHQNQQYILWGLGEYGLHEQTEKIGQVMKRNIEYTITHRWRGDAGILWWSQQDESLARHLRTMLAKYLPGHISGRELLFECHQTFFYNTVFYLNRLGITYYNDHARSALQFIFGNNEFGLNMLDLGGLDVPWRVISTAGTWKIKKNMFKGTYEIGSYVRALTHLLSAE